MKENFSHMLIVVGVLLRVAHIANIIFSISNPYRSQQGNDDQGENTQDEINAAFLSLNTLAPKTPN